MNRKYTNFLGRSFLLAIILLPNILYIEILNQQISFSKISK